MEQSFCLEVRPALSDDAPVIAQLAEQLGYPSSEEQIGERLRAFQAQPADQAVLVAELIGTGVVGWITLSIVRLIESDARVHIGGLVVDESVRGAGVGRALIAAAEHWTRERGLRTIGLNSNVKREEAHHFYQWLGFERAKTQFAFRKIVGE